MKLRYDERFARVKPLPFGQVYASLARFERDGLAVVTGNEAGEGPQRTMYAITAAGVTAVDQWLGEAEEPTRFAGGVLFTKTVLALLSGRSAADVLDMQRRVHLARMRELTAVRAAADPVQLLAVTYELNHLDADLRWIEEAGHDLPRLRADLGMR